MNVQKIVPADPLAALARNLGQDITDARLLVERLERVLAHVDEKVSRLKEQGVTVEVDLGPIGDAAASARRLSAPATKFALPRRASLPQAS